MTGYIYELAKLFAKFYQQCPIMNIEDEALRSARLTLVQSTLQVLREAMNLVLVPYLDRM